MTDARGRGAQEGQAGRVLIVDADWDTLSALSEALRVRGHAVVLATDGRTGLARAVETTPDVVIVDRDVPVVDVRTFLELLRENPRTSSARVFVMAAGDPARAAVSPHAEPLVKPFHAAEVAARVEQVLRAQRPPPTEPELRGDLSQVAIFDLLQVFAANRRTGTLLVESGGRRAEIALREGRIVDAAFGGAIGEKALYRALAETEGQFLFHPGAPPARVRIDAPTDMLLMEAVRRADEVAVLRKRLPPLEATLRRAKMPDATAELPRRLLAELAEPRPMVELLDAVAAPDLEILAALDGLLARGALDVVDPRRERVVLGDESDLVAWRAAALRLRRPGLGGTPRLGVLARAAGDVTRFARALARVDGFIVAADPPTPAGQGALGALGALRLGGAELELFALPWETPMRPLWGALLAPALVALWLAPEGIDLPGDDALDLLKSLGVSLVRAPDGWARAEGAVAALRSALSAVTPAQSERR